MMNRRLLRDIAAVLVLISLNCRVVMATDFAHPLNLTEAIEYAIENSPDIGIMQSRIEQANAQLGESLASFYPQISASLSYQHSDNPAQAFAMIIAQRRLSFNSGDFNHPGGVDNYRPQVTATYALFRGGRDYYLSKAAELGLESSELEKHATQSRLVNDVTAAFYGHLAARDSLRVSTRAIEAVTSELEMSRKRFDAGALLKSDLLSLEVQLAEARDAEIQSRNAVDMTLSMLKALLGMSAEQALEVVADDTVGLPEAPERLSVLVSRALAQHPSLLAAERRISAGEQQLKAAQAGHLPRADAYVSYGSDSKNLDYSTTRDNVSVGVMMEVDIFSGFATEERIRKVEFQLKEARESARKIKLGVESQVNAARLKLLEALSRVDVARAAKDAADEALRLVDEQRSAGVVTVTRFIEAEVARDRAYTRDIAAVYDARRAEAELKQAVGFWD